LKSIESSAVGLAEETARARRTKKAIKRYEATKKQAMDLGFVYVPMEQLIAEHETEDILLRLEALERVSRGMLPSQENSNALLGSVKRPTVTLSQALEIYCNQIAVGELLGKSDS